MHFPQVPLALGTKMTKNGLRIPCHCSKCCGASKDYRTVANHYRQQEAARPLFPASLDSPSEAKCDPIDNRPDHAIPNMEDQMEDEGNRPVPPPTAPEDYVSHVESLPNCHEPIYQTVFNALYVVPCTILPLYEAWRTICCISRAAYFSIVTCLHIRRNNVHYITYITLYDVYNALIRILTYIVHYYCPSLHYTCSPCS